MNIGLLSKRYWKNQRAAHPKQISRDVVKLMTGGMDKEILADFAEARDEAKARHAARHAERKARAEAHDKEFQELAGVPETVTV